MPVRSKSVKDHGPNDPLQRGHGPTCRAGRSRISFFPGIDAIIAAGTPSIRPSGTALGASADSQTVRDGRWSEGRGDRSLQPRRSTAPDAGQQIRCFIDGILNRGSPRRVRLGRSDGARVDRRGRNERRCGSRRGVPRDRPLQRVAAWYSRHAAGRADHVGGDVPRFLRRDEAIPHQQP